MNTEFRIPTFESHLWCGGNANADFRLSLLLEAKRRAPRHRRPLLVLMSLGGDYSIQPGSLDACTQLCTRMAEIKCKIRRPSLTFGHRESPCGRKFFSEVCTSKSNVACPSASRCRPTQLLLCILMPLFGRSCLLSFPPLPRSPKQARPLVLGFVRGGGCSC